MRLRALSLLLSLDALPGALHVGRRQSAVLVGEDMRMPPDHLARDRLDHVAEGECVYLLGHTRMKHDLQQQVAQFVLEVMELAARDRISDFVRLLDSVGRNGREILLEIPRTTGAGRSK